MPRDNNGVVGSGYGTSYCAVDCVRWWMDRIWDLAARARCIFALGS